MSAKVQNILKELRRRLEALYGDRLVKVILFGCPTVSRSGSEDAWPGARRNTMNAAPVYLTRLELSIMPRNSRKNLKGLGYGT